MLFIIEINKYKVGNTSLDGIRIKLIRKQIIFGHGP